MSRLTDFRQQKDAAFRDNHQSPLTPEQRRSFAGLAYYDENPDLALALTPEILPNQSVITMQTSTGDEAEYVRWGRVQFTVEGREAALTIYRDPGSGEMFLPFQDANRGGETYGAGRYLDVHQLDDGRVLVDFNYAYNPYCAYNDAWSCPIPPGENRLDVPIRAGEKTFPGGH